MTVTCCLVTLLHMAACSQPPAAEPSSVLEREQITQGPKNHLFGYIGHVGTIPWNASGRYIVALRTDFVDRTPGPDATAEIILLDTENDYAIRVVDESRGWNVQQGTMLYWNPGDPENQFFFNDRDPATGKVFCVLYDIKEDRRVREYRFEDTPVGNGGVAFDGKHFAAINYARMARLRPVTGYPGAWDWTSGVSAPEDDGVFLVDVETGKKELLVSFRELAEAVRRERPEIDSMPLFINHTLWSRTGERLFFFARANFRKPGRLNASFTIARDGTDLRQQETHIGGHPEWDAGMRMIGSIANRQAVFDVDKLYYVLHNRRTGETLRSGGYDLYGRVSGDLRCDPAPRWNREGDTLLIPSMMEDGTRQMFVLRLPWA